jgi:hypothetical protein
MLSQAGGKRLKVAEGEEEHRTGFVKKDSEIGVEGFGSKNKASMVVSQIL